jgi:hypothetical protein
MFAALSHPSTSVFMNKNIKHFVALAPPPFLCNYDNKIYDSIKKHISLIYFLGKSMGLSGMATPSCLGKTSFKEEQIINNFSAILAKYAPVFTANLFGLSAPMDDLSFYK